MRVGGAAFLLADLGRFDLQDLLARRLDSPAPAKWPPHATVGFVLVVCGAFWAGLFIVVRLLIH